MRSKSGLLFRTKNHTCSLLSKIEQEINSHRKRYMSDVFKHIKTRCRTRVEDYLIQSSSPFLPFMNQSLSFPPTQSPSGSGWIRLSHNPFLSTPMSGKIFTTREEEVWPSPLQPNLVKRLIIGEFESDHKNHFQIPQCILNKVKECCLSKI